ncbi:hypothetical protein AURDEDRAFT_115572 [Auricularia subglabra TFB-10046 SS5]|nr:hypothetical protein AURDEDRAFT_115572 [Auricularia subglabra TFB-10046 SS5]
MNRAPSNSERPTLPPLGEVFPDLYNRQAQAPPGASHRNGGLLPPPSGLQSTTTRAPDLNGQRGPGWPAVQAHPAPGQRFAGAPWSPGHSRSASQPHVQAPPRPSTAAPMSPMYARPPTARPGTPGRVEYGLHQLAAHGLETLRTDSQRPIERYRPQPAVEDNRPKNHICHYCNAAYSRRSALEIHIRRHTGERPFVCTICSRDYMSVSNLNRHYRQSHPQVEAPGDEV